MPADFDGSSRPDGTSDELNSRLSRIYDHLYANASVRTPPQIAREAGKILHVALFLEDVRRIRPAYAFSWAELRALQRGETDVVRRVASTVREDFVAMNAAWELYTGDGLERLSDTDIAFVVSELSGVLVSDPSRDVFGDSVEVFRSQWVKRHGGQFFTDQRVTRLAMHLLAFDPGQGDDLVDICAGTGGFLLAALNHLQGQCQPRQRRRGTRQIRHLAAKSLIGQEIDDDVREIANATLASRVGGLAQPLVQEGNSLLPDAFEAGKGRAIRFSSHGCAASNPPFGTKITIKDVNILRFYELAGGTPAGDVSDRLSPRPPDILFLEQNLRILKPGRGRLAIVLPYQILSGPQTRSIREWVLRHSDVLAVVDLPGETFQPHTGTKTCLLVLRRRVRPLAELPSGEERRIFMAMPRWIGHDRRGNPVYRRNADGSRSSTILSDFPQVERALAAFRAGGDPSTEHDRCFGADMSRVLEDPELRLNALFHRPAQHGGTLRDKRHGGAAGGWKSIELSAITERIFHPARFRRNYVGRGPRVVPFLGGTSVSQFLVRTEKWLRADDPLLSELQVRAGWVLVTRSGSTGIVALVPPAWDGLAVSEHVIRIVPRAGAVPGEYIYAFLRTSRGQELLARGVFGSVIDEITPDYVGSIEIPLPSRANLERIVEQVRAGEDARQRAIEGLTGAIDSLEALLAGRPPSLP